MGTNQESLTNQAAAQLEFDYLLPLGKTFRPRTLVKIFGMTKAMVHKLIASGAFHDASDPAVRVFDMRTPGGNRACPVITRAAVIRFLRRRENGCAFTVVECARALARTEHEVMMMIRRGALRAISAELTDEVGRPLVFNESLRNVILTRHAQPLTAQEVA